MRDAGDHVVHVAAAQIRHADRLAGGRLDDVRPGDEHVGVLTRHDDQVGQRRAVHGAARAWAEDDGDLRDKTARLAGLLENPPVLAERRDTFLDTRAAGVDQCDNRHFEADGHIHEVANLLAFSHAERAAAHREVLRIHGDRAPVHFAEPGDDGRTGNPLVDVAADETADFLEAVGVEQQVEAFAGRAFAFGMLAFAGVLLGGTREFGGPPHSGADRLSHVMRRGVHKCRGVRRRRGCLRCGQCAAHCRSPSASLSVDVPDACAPSAAWMSSSTSVCPPSTPSAGPTQIFLTVPLTGAYT